MYKAVFIDLDGTLLRKNHTVSDLTKQAIQNTMKKGIPVILVSARPLDAIIPISKIIGTAEYPIISLNGGYIVSGDEIIFKSSIDLKTTTDLTSDIQQYTNSILYYVEREWFSEVNNKWVEHEQRIMDVKIQVQPFSRIAAYLDEHVTGPNKIMVMDEAHFVYPAENFIKPLYPNLNIYQSQSTNLEVMNADASKAKAVQLLLEKMDIKQSEAIAIGDNYNDKEMIEFAGMGVAMGNAPDEIKAVADYITDTNNNDGVRKALEKFIL